MQFSNSLDSQKNKVLIFQVKVIVKQNAIVFALDTVVFSFQVGGTK